MNYQIYKIILFWLIFLLLASSLEAQTYNSKIAFQSKRTGNWEIFLMNPDGTNPVNITNNSADNSQPAWSLDGKKIAFTTNRDGNFEIYTMNIDGTNLMRLTNNSSNDSEPDWSPDGTKIAFRSNRDGNDEIYVMNSDGTNQINLTNNPSIDGEPQWSPDGTKILFSSWREGPTYLFNMNPNGSNVQKIPGTLTWVGSAGWSPDGQKIGFSAWGNLYVMNADGSNRIILLSNPSTYSPLFGSFSPDGSKIVFFNDPSYQNLNFDIYVMNSNGTNIVNVTNNSSLNNQGATWSPILSTSSITLTGRLIRGLAYEPDVLWVIHSDYSVGNVVKISKINPNNGQILSESGSLSWNGRGITIGDGALWVADALSDVIRKVDKSNFNLLAFFNTPGSEPNGLAFDGNYLWLSDPWFQKIYKLNSSGSVLSSFNIPNYKRTGLEWLNNGLWTNTDDKIISFYDTEGIITSSKTLQNLTGNGTIYDIAIGSGKIFISNGEKIDIQNWELSHSNPNWYYTNTGVNHNILIPLNINPNINGSPLSNGDYIGVFYDSSGVLRCTGYSIWTGTGNIVVTAWGDDQTSGGVKEGFASGELIKWMIWRKSDAKTFRAYATYQSGGLFSNDSTFAVNGLSGLASLVGTTLVSVEANAKVIPDKYILYQNYPNPFNPSTTIKFALPERVKVNLSIYNLLGEKVAELINGELTAGYHEVEFRGLNFPSGVYFYRIKTDKFISTKKMVIAK